jgi:hypothetical protein
MGAGIGRGTARRVTCQKDQTDGQHDAKDDDATSQERAPQFARRLPFLDRPLIVATALPRRGAQLVDLPEELLVGDREGLSRASHHGGAHQPRGVARISRELSIATIVTLVMARTNRHRRTGRRGLLIGGGTVPATMLSGPHGVSSADREGPDRLRARAGDRHRGLGPASC